MQTPSTQDREPDQDSVPVDGGRLSGTGIVVEEIRFDEPWNRSLFRPLLITTLVLCLDVALLAVMRRFMTATNPAAFNILLVAAVAGAVIGCYTSTILADVSRRAQRTLGYRLAELATILLLVRLALWTFVTGWPPVEAMMVYPLTTLLDALFIAALLVVGLSWGVANQFTGLFLEMALRPDELQTLDDAQRESREAMSAASRWIRSNRAAILNRFAGQWIMGGALIVVLAASSQIGPGQNGFFALIRQNIPLAVILSAILYFVVGLILLGQGRLATLRARWALEGLENPPEMMRTWPLYVLGVVLVIAMLAALLPFGGTFWLARIVMTAFAILQYVALFVLNLLFLLASLFTGKQEDTILEQPSAPFQPFPTPSPAAATESPVPPWLGGAFFWIITAVLLGYAAYVYLQGKGVDFGWFTRLWQRLRHFWHSLFGDIRAWQRAVRRRSAGEAAAGHSGSSLGTRFRRLLGQMSPEEQVRYYYLDTLEQAQEHGIPRRVGETPLAYAPRLRERLAEEQRGGEDPPPEGRAQPPDGTAVAELTDAFVRVRYASRPVPQDEVGHLKQIWDRLRRLLT